MKKVLIIGSGLGGLSTALRLSTRGYQVEIVEKYEKSGGRLNQLVKDGFTFDVGPSFFSMSYEFDELFMNCNLPNPLQLEELDPIYSVNFSGSGKTYQIFKDLEKLSMQFNGSEPHFKIKAENYLAVAKKIFHDTENIIIKNNFSSKIGYLTALTRVPWKHAPRMFRSMWKVLDRYFSSEEVKIIFSLVAFFLGSTPFRTPAVYSLLNYTELQHDGYWNVKGGMYKIVEHLMALLEKRNVKIHYNTEIVDFVAVDGKVKAFVDQTGNEWNADVYVVNADAASFRGKVMKRKKYNPQKLDKLKWTLAPFTIYLGVKGKIKNIDHHNYFLGDNFREYANTIFTSPSVPEKPYYYVNVNSKSNPESAPEGCENIFILCPVPDLRFKPDWSDSEQLADDIIDDLSKRIDFNLKANTLTRTIWNPNDWEQKFNLYKGSGLGLGHDMDQIGGFRPSNKDEKMSNLYYVGASTTPGTGLPIVVISSSLVTKRITHEHPII